MRVVAGEFRGRKLKAVPGSGTRPTTDKVKEALFNIIGPYFDGGMSLDLYAGSGGLSIEAVSRGIKRAVLIDHHYQAIKTIRDNVTVTKSENQFEIYKQEAQKALNLLAKRQVQFTLVFLDPPYAQQKIVTDLETLRTLNLLADQALIVAETDKNAKLPQQIPGFEFVRQQDYGITVLTIYRFLKGNE
ncbi:16S rRNA (guanine(966)-N(2))-methyltransferase RsmD [Paucilactobacillus kaifaensis]|uniref:16S rRNA (guanine(966)-N(2))-methyltransferase RsmD n=1 Tax=Paucilactobacillus kaifaensis TaxID=2559921 RepID=UPI0010F4AF70|nr:16S rRNA (guanine(966)-N(2))-methyltransferase RsmD [Paucilactobacillus kaifaensis]